MTKTSHLRPRRWTGRDRTQVSFQLSTEADQLVWQAAKAHARSHSVTTSSLVIEALAEYLKRHPVGAGDE